MSEFTNLKSKLLTEQVQEQIYQYILNTPVNVGSKLPNEFELGERFGVGRSTIREAVKHRVSRGILEVSRGGRPYVIGRRPADRGPLCLRGVDDKVYL